MAFEFFITDVFADRKYQGNQLATFLDAKGLDPKEMQRIAREMNFSETSFIMSKEQNGGGYDVRIFSPDQEMPFAGHPTLGTAFIINTFILNGKASEVRLNLGIGQVSVSYQGDVMWMEQRPPSFGKGSEVNRMAEALGIESKELDDRFPIQEVSTGLPHLIVPLKRLHILKQLRPNREMCRGLLQDIDARNILVFCPFGQTPEQSCSVRVFAFGVGVDEDPATGSGNGCLAAYLVKHRYFDSEEIDIQVGQGYEIGRPSRLFLRAEEREGSIKVRIGGRVFLVARGVWDP